MAYKSILWIDDCDDNDSSFPDDFLNDEKEGKVSEEDIEIIRSCFGKYSESVHLIKEYKKALYELETKNNLYDLVVFDINMQKGMDLSEYTEIKEILGRKRVCVKDIYEEFIKKAGMYLYLFLLNCGYPNNRMVILTGNGISYPRDFLEAAHIVPIDKREDPQRFIYTKKEGHIAKEDVNWIGGYYAEDYYRVRRLVYKACEYWKQEISDKDAQNLAFNEIYYNGKPEAIIEIETFISMLNRIKILFPVQHPQDCEGLYYQALQIVSLFHEESAKLDVFDKKVNRDRYAKLRNFHQAIRNFRNWSAHNQFSDNKVKADLFVYIFSITLRSYFQNIDSQFYINKEGQIIQCYEEYEKEYFKNLIYSSNDEEFKTKYQLVFNRHFMKVKSIGDKKCWECEDINDLLLASGRCKTTAINERMYFSDILLNIIDKWIVQSDAYDCNQSEISFKYVLRYDWQAMNSPLQTVNNEQDTLIYLAYTLFSKLV